MSIPSPRTVRLSLTLALSVCMSCALAAESGAAKAPPMSTLASCAGSGPGIVFGPADSRALLNADDRDQVHAAMLARYPALQRDGFVPWQILLWHSDKWLFVSLAASDEDPAAVCFTATFAAEPFEFTGELIRKYFMAGATRI